LATVEQLPEWNSRHKSDKPVGTGTGLGLAISYLIIVEKYGGQISCVSVPGKGSEFVIKIPVKAQYL
jgi:signal transduction histidine kinase